MCKCEHATCAKDPFVCDFGPMATQMSKPHSSAVGCDFLSSYEGVAAMCGNKVPRYGKGVTPSGAAHYPKILRTAPSRSSAKIHMAR